MNDNEINDYEKINLYFAIGKAYEDKRNYKKSVDFFIKGNQLQRKNVNFDIAFYQNLANQIKSLFNKIKIDDFKKESEKSQKIFILGMPRSGTTLIEQILLSHSLTSSVSEANFLPNKIIKKIYNKNDDEILNFLRSRLTRRLS